MVEVLVPFAQRRVERFVLVSSVVRRIVIRRPQEVSNRAVMAASVMSGVDAGTQRPLVGKLRIEVRQRAKPAVVVVGNPDEVGTFSTNGVNVQTVRSKLKEL